MDTSDAKTYQQIIEGDWALPDPSWPYADIYSLLQLQRRELESLLHCMAQIEEPTSETDIEVREALDAIGTALNSIRGKLTQ